MDEKNVRNRMEKTLDALKKTLTKIRTGVATPAMLDNITVDYYGTATPINHVASVTVPEPRVLYIKPFEKKMLDAIEKAIHMSDLGLPPNNDGDAIRLNMPVLTTERREEMAKKVRAAGEEGKIGLRNIRRDENENIKQTAKELSKSEDQIKIDKEIVQSITNEFVQLVDEIIIAKEKNIMDV